METSLHSFFLSAPGGHRLCIHHAPPAGEPVHHAVLYLHPFAEEMNKSRRMAALTSRALARSGCAVLQVDLLGCGDSSGDFGDATWSAWLADVQQAAHWLRERHDAPLWLWGLRAGCLLACEAAQLVDAHRFLFWQPPASGKTQLQQFLRLKLAGSLADGKPLKGEDPRQHLADGRMVEIAGYRLHPALAHGLEQAQLVAPAKPAQAFWFETSTRDGATLLPATQTALAHWRDAGCDVQARVVPGPAFWQTQEIEDAPALVKATVAALESQAVAA